MYIIYYYIYICVFVSVRLVVFFLQWKKNLETLTWQVGNKCNDQKKWFNQQEQSQQQQTQTQTPPKGRQQQQQQQQPEQPQQRQQQQLCHFFIGCAGPTNGSYSQNYLPCLARFSKTHHQVPKRVKPTATISHFGDNIIQHSIINGYQWSIFPQPFGMVQWSLRLQVVSWRLGCEDASVLHRWLPQLALPGSGKILISDAAPLSFGQADWGGINYIYRLIPSWRLIRNPANGYFQHFPTCWTCALLAEFEGENVEFCLVCGGNLQSLGNTFPELYVTGCANFWDLLTYITKI